MKTIVDCILFLTLLLCFNGCKHNDGTTSIKRSKTQIEITDFDTIKVKHFGNGLMLLDQRAEKLAFFDRHSQEIIVTEKDGTIHAKFDKTVLGKDDLGDAIYGLGFKEDSVLAVLSDKGYFMYDLEGNLMERHLHPFDISHDLYITGEFKLCYNRKRNMLLSLLTTAADVSQLNPEFFHQARHITTFELDSHRYKWNVPYESEGSYLQDEYFTQEWGARFDASEDTLVVVWGRDPIVYYFNLSNFNKLSSFHTDPEYFKQLVKFPFSGNQGLEIKEALTSLANSEYKKVVLTGDTLIATYSEGLPLNFFETMRDLNDLNERSYQFQHYYLQVFVNGIKVASDLELPKEFPFLALASSNEIILTEQPLWRHRSDGYCRFLKARIRFTNGAKIDNISLQKH